MVSGGSFSVREGHTVPVPSAITEKLLALPITFDYASQVNDASHLRSGPEQSHSNVHNNADRTLQFGSQQEHINFSRPTSMGWDIYSTNVDSKLLHNVTTIVKKSTFTGYDPNVSVPAHRPSIIVETYEILSPPREGRLKLESSPHTILNSISREQVEKGELLVSMKTDH